MNHLSDADRLANRFSAMRHGQNKANAAGIIVSRMDTDRRGDYGLSAYGRQQVLAVAQGCRLPADTVICSSDFARARQTAEVMRAHLGGPGVVFAERVLALPPFGVRATDSTIVGHVGSILSFIDI